MYDVCNICGQIHCRAHSQIHWPELDTPDDKERARELHYIVPLRVTLVERVEKEINPFTKKVARLVTPYWQDMLLAQLLFKEDDHGR